MNDKMYQLGNNRSIIRELFEFSKSKKQEVGVDNVYDFSIGNPSIPPSANVTKELNNLLNIDPCILHGYTSAQGDYETRDKIANNLNDRFNTNYSADMIYITCGAAASLCITFKALTSSCTDEILSIAPYFTEYKVFIESAGATFKVIPPLIPSFDINLEELEKSITQNTIGIVLNSPNNPSGVVYSEDTIKKLSSLLLTKEKEFNHPIYIISDEPYREIVFDNILVPHIPNYYHNTIICYSYSKSLSLPGERIGYILVPSSVYNHKDIYLACLGAGRAYGYVCAPSMFQKLINKCYNEKTNISSYEENKNLLYKGLVELGYECVYPQGAFYLFVKSLEPNAYNFMEKAKKYNIIVVPSDSFGVTGYVRLAYCVSKETIINSLPNFKKLIQEYK